MENINQKFPEDTSYIGIVLTSMNTFGSRPNCIYLTYSFMAIDQKVIGF